MSTGSKPTRPSLREEGNEDTTLAAVPLDRLTMKRPEPPEQRPEPPEDTLVGVATDELRWSMGGSEDETLSVELASMKLAPPTWLDPSGVQASEPLDPMAQGFDFLLDEDGLSGLGDDDPFHPEELIELREAEEQHAVAAMAAVPKAPTVRKRLSDPAPGPPPEPSTRERDVSVERCRAMTERILAWNRGVVWTEGLPDASVEDGIVVARWALQEAPDACGDAGTIYCNRALVAVAEMLTIIDLMSLGGDAEIRPVVEALTRELVALRQTLRGR